MMRSAAFSPIIIQEALVLVFIRCGMIEAFAIDSCFIVPINSGQSVVTLRVMTFIMHCINT